MNLTIDKLNNSNKFNFDKYFFNTNTNSNNNNLNFNYTENFNNSNNLNFIKNNNNFLNINLDDKSDDILAYKNYFSNYNYNKSVSFNKIYIPKVFNASQSNIYNGLPWFLDYVHLTFWFFFLSIVISSLFIIYFFNFVWNNQENKYPIRETRGFSRAQTGDTMTAIIPMTWSITMLLHASTHSSNFDENTTGTQFCLTVIAYQWGWNYYYPKDIISIFNSMPIKVGHNNIDYYCVFDNYYSKLLDISRNQILTKNFSLGIGSSKIGKNNIQTLQSLFFKPYGLNQNWQLPTVLFIDLNYKKNNFNLKSLELNNDVGKCIQQIDDLSLNHYYNNNDIIYSNLMHINTLNNENFNYYYNLLNNKFNVFNFYKNLKYSFFVLNLELNLFYYKITNFNELINQSTNLNLKFKKSYNFINISKLKTIDSHRNKNTFYSSSNKIYKAYRYLLDEYNRPLDNNYIEFMDKMQARQDALDYVNKVRSLGSNTINYIYNKMYLLEFNVNALSFIDTFNININQWLLNNDYETIFKNQLFWLNILDYNKISFNFNSIFNNNFNKNINISDFNKNTFFLFSNNLNIFNFKKIYQSFYYNSNDNSYSFYNNSLLTFEDFGFINSSTIKELWYQNNIYSNFYLFNILKFFNNTNKFLFNKILFNNNNYKFWEIDSNLLLFQNNIFNINLLFDNNIFVSNNSFIYFWPSFISDFSKNIKYFLIYNNSIHNILSYNYYSIRSNYSFFKNLFKFNDKFIYFFKIKKNKNKFFDLYFDFENNIFNFSEFYYFNSKINKDSLFKFKIINYFINDYNLKNIKNTFILNTLKLLINNENYLIKLNNNSILFYNIKNLNYCNTYINLNYLNNKILLFNNFNLLVNSYLFNCFDLFSKIDSSLELMFWNIFFFKNSNNSLLYFDKPIRVSLKLNDPLDYNFKLSNNISNIFYTNKKLFQWQLNWSNIVKNYNLPLFKFYRGYLEKKFFSGHLNSKNINNPFYNDSKFEDYKLQIFKNFSDSDLEDKKNFSYWSKSPIYSKYKYECEYNAILDFEKFNFVKNYLINLPNVGDDVDVNYILKYLTFDVNTSRRNDHNSKFKVFFGPLFNKYIKKLVTVNNKNIHILNTLNLKNINFFKNFNINYLKYDSFYLQNVSFQKNYFIINLKPISKYSNLEINFLKNNFYWNFNKLSNNSLNELKKIKLLLGKDSTAYDWFKYENNYVDLFLYNSNFLNYWKSLWFFKDNLYNFSNKLFFNKNFKDNSDILSKFFLINSFKDKELKNINTLNNNLYINYDFIFKDISSILSYQNFFDIKNNSIFSNNLQLNLFSNLNFFKYTIYGNFNDIKNIYYNYYLLQLQKSNKSRFDYKEINNNISNIKRLRVSKGICLPSDFSIHIICASKDVIHSWAIPGLGIKIDAIPGFNSHRRVIFRWRGLYWGQCMEVCGRYHHWMPILIRIVHKDLFLSWCLSFLKALNNKNFKYEKYYFDEILLLSWLSDSSNSIILEDFFKNITNSDDFYLKLDFFKSQL